MAAMGETLVARRAGMTAAATVTTTPATRPMAAVRPRNTIGADGSSKPMARMIASSPWAAPSPRTMPAAEATMPTSRASVSTEPMSWVRLAPMARSRPSSRVRWATRIENVLKMMKAPTSRATAANMRRAVVRKPRALVHDSWASLAAWS